MSSLQEHLDRHDLAEADIAFRRDCPVCRAERVLGRLPSTSLVSPRACAAVTALAMVTSTAAPTAALADGQGVASPAPPSPPPPTASVEAAGGGAAPADGGAPAAAPAASEHDDGEPSRHEGSPGDSAPAPAPSSAGTNETAPGVTGSTAPPPTAPPASGGPPVANDPPSASTDRAVGTDSAGGDNGNPAAPDEGGDAVPPAAPAAGVPAPAASPPSHNASQVTSGRAEATTPPHAAHRSSRRPGVELTDAAPAPVHSRAGGSASATPHGPPPHGGAARGDARSSTGSARGEATGAAGPRPAATPSRPSGRHQRVEVAAHMTYRVRHGDSLWRIAARHLGPDATTAQTAREVNRLWELNQQRIGTGNPDLIFPGQTLRL